MKTKTFLGWAWRGALLSLTGLLVWGCSKYEETNTTVAPVASYPYALVACSNFAGKNSLAVIQLKPATTPRINYLVNLGSDPKLDPVVRTADLTWTKRAFVVQRESGSATGKGKVALLDPANRFQVKTRFQVNDGINPANPQDLLVLAADKAYVTRLEPPYNDILIVNPDTGDTLGRVDFTGQGTNPDGLPRLYKMFPLQGRVWVLMQNYSSTYTYDPGLIGVVNPNPNTIETIIKLSTKNPTDFGYDNEANLLYVASTGDWTDPATAGIEAVNPVTQASEGVLIHGNDLGGFITRMVMIARNNAYLVVTKSDFSGDKVVQVNPAAGTIGPTLYEYPGLWWVSDLALDERQNLLLIADNSASQVMLMDLATGLIVDSFDTPVPPVSLAIWEGED